MERPNYEPSKEVTLQPFRVFIVKTVATCNLNCDYCYMYNLADPSTKGGNAYMSDEVVSAAAERVAEHAEEYDLDRTLVVYHGGEPLLADLNNPNYYTKATNTFRSAILNTRGLQTKVSFGLQTNGILLNEDNLQRFNDLEVRIGVSIDGTIESHDAVRRYHNGKGSYRDTLAGLTKLRNYPEMQSTVLCVIDIDSDPLRVYNNLSAYNTRSIEFILPLANQDLPPKAPSYEGPIKDYADWLIPIFKKWYSTPIKQRPSIVFFEEILRLIAGQEARLEYIGGTSSDNIVIATNGDIEDTDTLRSSAKGLVKLGLNVLNNSFSEALHHPKVRRRQMGRLALSTICQSCNLVDICGGGYYVHRYSEQNDFNNPSVYCNDLYKIIVAILTESCIVPLQEEKALKQWRFVNGYDT